MFHLGNRGTLKLKIKKYNIRDRGRFIYDPIKPLKKPEVTLNQWIKEEEEKVVGTIKAVASNSEELTKRVKPQEVFAEEIKKRYGTEPVWQPTGWVYDFSPKLGEGLVNRDPDTGEILTLRGEVMWRDLWDKHYKEWEEEKRRKREPIRLTHEDIVKIGKLVAKDYAEEQAREAKEIYLKYGRFSDKRVVLHKYGFSIEELKTPEQLFMRDVEKGKIRDPVTGLKLSESQVKGKPPEQGFLQEVGGALFGVTEDYLKIKNNSPYYAGLVIKVCGDYDPELSDDHNTWAIITRILDPWHFEATQEGSSKRLILRDTDVKGWVGDMKRDFVGIGKERHENEVKPIIEKALRGKEPVTGETEQDRAFTYEDTVKRVRRMLGVKGYSIEEQRKKAEDWLKHLEEHKDDYEKEDYRRLKSYAEEELRAVAQVEEEIKRWGVNETIKRGWD